MLKPLTLSVLLLTLASCTAPPPKADTPTTAAAPASPTSVLSEKDAKQKAIDQIVASSHSEISYLRSNAIEAAQNLPDRVVPLVQLGLNDPEPVVRFAALVSIGKLKLKSLTPSARRFMDDPNESVRAAARFALRACSEDADMNLFASMLSGPDPRARGNAAFLLGWLGEKSAIPMLKELAKAPMPRASSTQAALVRVQIAEAVIRLGDDEALAALRASAFSQFDEVRVLAAQTAGRVGDRAMEKAMWGMLKDNPIEVELAAAESLARLGHADGFAVVVNGSTSAIPAVRAQAATTLGLFKGPSAHEWRIKLLGDSIEQVRLAAASAIVQAAATPGVVVK